jgi:hypothetical protein
MSRALENIFTTAAKVTDTGDTLATNHFHHHSAKVTDTGDTLV